MNVTSFTVNHVREFTSLFSILSFFNFQRIPILIFLFVFTFSFLSLFFSDLCGQILDPHSITQWVMLRKIIIQRETSSSGPKRPHPDIIPLSLLMVIGPQKQCSVEEIKNEK